MMNLNTTHTRKGGATRPEDASPQYNPFEKKWELGTDRSELEYNSYSSKWERTEPGEELEWNPWTGKWGYARE